MTILAIETSAKAVSTALWRDGKEICFKMKNDGQTHSVTLLPLVTEILGECEITLSDVENFALPRGPGSFTGLRIGLSVVKGFAWPQAKKCAAISTLLAAAYCHIYHEGVIIPVMDARRSEAYTASFLCENGVITRLTNDDAAPLDDAVHAVLNAEKPVLICGDGAHLMKKYDFTGRDVSIATEETCCQNASGVARAAFYENNFEDAGHIKLNYLRKPQAERERLEKQEIK